MQPLLIPLTDIHFNPPARWEIDTTIDISYIYSIVSVGVFILVIVLINFVNLTTAQAGKRQKELGLRKTLGSSTIQLRFQFFMESCSIIIISAVTAITLVFLLLPQFNSLIDKNISFYDSVLSPNFLSIAIPIFISIALFTSILPAFYFTRKIGNYSTRINQFIIKEKANSPGRNILVILQFVVAITLVISTITVYNQLQLINNGYLGKSRQTVIGIRTSRMGDSIQAQRYKLKVQEIPGVISNTLGMHLPRQSDFGRINTRYMASTSGAELHYWNKFDADGGFLKTYDLKLIAGRDFEYIVEPNVLIVNEAIVRVLGIDPSEAIGIYLEEDSINYAYGSSDGLIVGVVEDFVYKSIKEKIEPLVICANNWVEGVLSVKLGAGHKEEMLERLQSAWREVYPERPFEYWFLDKEFDRMYNQERRLGKLIPMFSGLAIVIAMLGLFALTIFISELRKKEIGIRKVLGSSTAGILSLLGWQFLKTLIPAIFVGVPLAYFGMTYWLESFTYRVSVDLEVIVLSVISITVISIFTICYKIFGIATSNPVDSLRYE